MVSEMDLAVREVQPCNAHPLLFSTTGYYDSTAHFRQCIPRIIFTGVFQRDDAVLVV